MKRLLRLGVVLYGAIVLPLGTTGCSTKEAIESQKPADEQRLLNDDLMQGTGIWAAVSIENNGSQKNADLQLSLLREKLKLRSGDITIDGTVTLGPSKSPKTFDVIWDHEGHTSLTTGIYKLEGDSLTVCYAEVRPTEFKAPEKSGRVLIVWKREN